MKQNLRLREKAGRTLRLLSWISAVVLSLVSCQGSPPPRDSAQVAPPPSAVSPPNLVTPPGRLRIDFEVTVEPAVAKAYGDALNLPAADLEPAFVGDCLADGFGEMTGLWNLSRTRDTAPESGQVRARVGLELAGITKFNLGGKWVGSVTGDLELGYRNVAGETRWKATFGFVQLSMPLASDNRERWRLILKKAGLDIFWRSLQEGFILALQADRQPLAPAPALFAILRDKSFGWLDQRLEPAIDVATVLREPRLVGHVVELLRPPEDLARTAYAYLVEYLGAIYDPAARECLFGQLAGFPAGTYDGLRENFLYALVRELAGRADTDTAVEPALRRKLEETTAPKYRRILTEALAELEKAASRRAPLHR
jgi:hypothetical protein